MKYLYIKNYKGFEEEIIKLKDVNFLVGENSTGKTSVLKLINILNSRAFWFEQQFNNTEVSLGYFDEIINKNAKENYFRLGFEISDKENIRRVLIEFKKEKSIPIINQIRYCNDKIDYHIIVQKKQIKYKTKRDLNLSFSEWLHDLNFEGNYKIEKMRGKSVPLFIIFSLIEHKSSLPFSLEPVLFKNYYWLAPIRAKAKRIYESYDVKFSPEGEHIPALLKELFSNKTKKESARILSIINQFGQESNLYDKILINNLGLKKESPFEIIVQYDNIEVKLPNVGYGVSQCLPVVVEILSSKNSCFSIQQPEVHLHPKAQAAFGSFLFNAAAKDNNIFLIETHSDFTINRFRYSMSKKENTQLECQILFFERDKHTNIVNHININSNGSFEGEVPVSYRDFFIDEELKLLEL